MKSVIYTYLDLDYQELLTYNCAQLTRRRIKIMNEKHIQQVLEIEKQAQEIHESALREAQQLPVQAEQEAQALIERARLEAQAEAQKIVARAQADEETAHIMAEAEEKNKHMEMAAKKNFDRAVNYILDHVVSEK
ncbi:MAG TPA: hypothetical protein VLZ89_09415 [Anaerolineales bacterium]|nr:hypothetical protein [Anaerolineales bacterium]